MFGPKHPVAEEHDSPRPQAAHRPPGTAGGLPSDLPADAIDRGGAPLVFTETKDLERRVNLHLQRESS